MHKLIFYSFLILIITSSAIFFIQCPAVKQQDDSSNTSSSLQSWTSSSTSSTSSSTSSENYIPVPLIKTGQTDTYGTGDDGNLKTGTSWPVPRFSANTAGTILDNLTGLIWEKSPLVAARNWAGALTYANDATLDGFIDWRLPNINELESMINSGVRFADGNNASWLNAQGFANIQIHPYWANTTYAADTNYAWSMDQANGRMGSALKITSSFMYSWIVRGNAANLVKTGQTVSYSTGDDGDLEQGLVMPVGLRFTIISGTVKDNITGLFWQKSLNTSARTFSNALTYANDLTADGFTDWRLPNKKELRSLFNYGQSNMVSYLTAAGFTNIQSQYYWTSTYYESSGGSKGYIIDFANVSTLGIGAVFNNNWSNPVYVIAVRGGS